MFFGGGIPFEQFGGGGFERPQPRGEIDNTGYYTLLGVEKTASEADIKKAYRKLALKVQKAISRLL